MRPNGIIDISNLTTPPEKHELATAKIFAELGKNIEFIQPSNTKGCRTPDFIMDGKMWEVKSPVGKGKTMIENLFHKAFSQSKYMIFDLRRTNLSDQNCIKKLEREVHSRRGIGKVLVIKKNKEIVEIK